MAVETISISTPQNTKFSTPAKLLRPNSTFNFRVVVRARPFLPHEIDDQNGNPNSSSCVSVLEQDLEPGDEISVYLKDQHSSRNECFRLDSCFAQEDNNVSQIFSSEVCPLIPGIFYGCNATVFAYGATGSGKTYTMEGTEELPGLMPLAMSTVLSMCRCTGSSAEISYFEIYMERCVDLLAAGEGEIAVLDDGDGQIHLRGASRVPVRSIPEFQAAFSRATQRRKVGQTSLNDASSRSHGVLVIHVASDRSLPPVAGKLNLIDLAGNEDNRRACNDGARLQESAKINQSLFALSKVIYALNNNCSRIPFRESKLTRILQDSLSGTSRALMVACLNPGEYYESVHTVSLAARSRHISNALPSSQKTEAATVKVDMEAKLRAWLECKGKTKGTAMGSASLSRTPCSVKLHPGFHRSLKSKLVAPRADSSVENREIYALQRSLFEDGSTADSFMEMTFPGSGADTKASEDEPINDPSAVASDSYQNPPAAADYYPGNTATPCTGKPASLFYNPKSSPFTVSDEPEEAIRRSPARKALSPIDPSVTPSRTPSALTHESSKSRCCSGGTPLNKFSAVSSNLKSSLAQQYVDFLNEASLEELVEIKGIGLKRAEYILELRRSSPLKSLMDLEKIGLSSKQVRNLFSTAARGIFG